MRKLDWVLFCGFVNGRSSRQKTAQEATNLRVVRRCGQTTKRNSVARHGQELRRNLIRISTLHHSRTLRHAAY